ncbi:hypothetical protein TNCV_231821 [Trichonephila clavipes]|nr:hypothetical protein TNCV_231821 [Trichonephila clavipes]
MEQKRSISDEVETLEQEIDQTGHEPDEIMVCNHDSERKCEKSDEHMKLLSRKGRFSKCHLRTSSKMAGSYNCTTRHTVPVKKTQARKKSYSCYLSIP